MDNPLERGLQALARRGRLRALMPRHGHDFTSNDYLGFAESAALKEAAEAAIARGVPVGAGGSRLLRGNHPEHEALEREAAVFFGAESALYFGSGYDANLALFSTLPQRGDLIVHDALIHASVHEGMRVGRTEAVSVPHNDAQAFDDAIRNWRAGGGKGRAWIAVESLYSMDGDRAPLDELAQIAARHEVILVIDEAHATGVWGPQGRGFAHALEGRADIITLHTCGKALGTTGGLVCAPPVLCDFLINRARPFIYATAPSPLMAAITRAAVALCASADAERARLHRLIASAGQRCEAEFGYRPSETQILPIHVGTDRAAVALAEALQQRGFDARAIRPPTVPEGTCRLRIALTLHADETVLGALFDALAEEMRKLAA
jgi:8-amino-7-oxononanoate synthase